MALTPLTSGPWTGVYDTTDPYDDQPDKLVNATNGYFLDPTTPGGFYSRPGFTQGPAHIFRNPGAQSGAYSFANADGTFTTFVAVDGKVYRQGYAGVALTLDDVTPTGVTISNDDGTSTPPTTRYYMTQLAGNLVFSDGVNPVWLGSALTSTPITAAAIDVDGAGGTYAIQGAPTLYQGSLVMILKSVGTAVLNTQPGVGFLWCEPNQPSVGYEQSGYADFFNYIQTGSAPLYAALGTNEGLVLWREAAIGIANGPLNQLQSSPTTATVATNVGTAAPACVVTFGRHIYFVDRLGRPYRMLPDGSAPEPIWQQMRGQYDRTPDYLAHPAATALVGHAWIDPQLNLVLMAPYTASASGSGGNYTALAPNVAFAFHAETGIYLGVWQLGGGGYSLNCATTFRDNNGNPVTLLVQEDDAALAYWIWVGAALSAGQWVDYNKDPIRLPLDPAPSVTTGRLGYNESVTWSCRNATAVVMTDEPGVMTVTTPYVSSASEGTITTQGSYDGTHRGVYGPNILAARGMQVTVAASGGNPSLEAEDGNALIAEDGVALVVQASAQWGIQRVALLASPRRATIYDA